MNEKQYMVGEIAAATGLTVRTLQHYDNIGLLPVSGRTPSGRRYYTQADMVRLEQIIFYKSMGFSLGEIEEKLIIAQDLTELKEMLKQQEYLLLRKIEQLHTSFATIDAAMEVIDAGKQPPFNVLLKFINTLPGDDVFEWAPSMFSEEQNKVMSGYFKDLDDVQKFYHTWKSILINATALLHSGVAPDSQPAQALAKRWWDMLLSITNGDIEALNQFSAIGEAGKQRMNGEEKMMVEAYGFIEQAFEIYFINNLSDNPKSQEEK